MSAKKAAVLGRLRPVKTTEDTLLYEYRTPRRALRGGAYLLLAAGLIAGSFRIGVVYSDLIVWLLAAVPAAGATVLIAWGLLDLVTRGLFELEVDRRARTLALSMPMEQGQALAKVGFADVTAVNIVERRPLPGTRGRTRWGVSLAMKDGRKIGIGLLENAAEAERLASSFGDLLGVSMSRSIHEARE